MTLLWTTLLLANFIIGAVLSYHTIGDRELHRRLTPVFLIQIFLAFFFIIMMGRPWAYWGG